MKTTILNLLLSLCVVACSSAPSAKTHPSLDLALEPTDDAKYIRANYQKTEHRIPMRDGITLFTAVYSPKDTSTTYPIILFRTPYSVSPYGADNYRENHLGSTMLMTREKFIFVYQDVRGQFMSDGEFVNMRPIIADKKTNSDVDESSDAYDTIDWLIKDVPNNNGNVGMWGISYPGFYAAAALVDAHPALKAVSPQAPIADWFFDDFHHHGAFFPAHAFWFLYSFGRPIDGRHKEWPDRFDPPTQDSYKFFLEDIGPLKNFNAKYYKNEIPYWNEFIEHPNYDAYWQARNLLPHLGKTSAAVMTVGGWYDAEDLYGSFKIHQALEKNNPDSFNMLVAGPWPHGGWSRTEGTSLGNVYFGDSPASSDHYVNNIELPFFKHFLKGTEKPKFGRAHVFETGTNKWRNFKSWPPDGDTESLYFGYDSSLDFMGPERQDVYDEFLSDPSNPVPYTERTGFRMSKEYMTDDQRFVQERPDVLVFKSPPLDEPMTIGGPMKATLFVSTSGTDADWIVKVIDEYPSNHPGYKNTQDGISMGGYQQMVRSEVIRGRFRNSYSNPEPFTPGKIEKVEFELLDILHTFKPGHKITIQVQSTWFPLVDRNPQKYVDNIYNADASDFQKAKHRVYRSLQHPSHIEINMLETEDYEQSTSQDHQSASSGKPDEDTDEPVICEDNPVPISMIRDNIDTTQLSAVVRINKVKVVGANGGPPKKTGYVNHMYTVTVLEKVRGKSHKTFTYGVMADADSTPRKVGTVMFVSLCGDGKNKFYCPDNGYVFKASPAFIDGIHDLKIDPTIETEPAACP